MVTFLLRFESHRDKAGSRVVDRFNFFAWFWALRMFIREDSSPLVNRADQFLIDVHEVERSEDR